MEFLHWIWGFVPDWLQLLLRQPQTPGWIGAFLSASIAILAIFGEQIRGRIFKPKLVGSMRMGAPDVNLTPVLVRSSFFDDEGERRESMSHASSYYFRLSIENQGSRTATDVEVYLKQLSRANERGAFIPVNDFIPQNLRWSNSDKTHLGALHPKMSKHVDVARVMEPYDRDRDLDRQDYRYHLDLSDDTTTMKLLTEFTPTTRTNIIPPGTYQILMQVASHECKPAEIRFNIHLSGKWFFEEEKMLKRHAYMLPVDK